LSGAIASLPNEMNAEVLVDMRLLNRFEFSLHAGNFRGDIVPQLDGGCGVRVNR
jgi:hypothetical protein